MTDVTGETNGPTCAPAAIGVAVFGRDRHLVVHTPGFPGLLGLDAESTVPGTPLATLLTAVSVDCRLPDLDGDKAPAPLRCHNSKGRTIDIGFERLRGNRICVTVSDITASGETENELRRARVAAEVANQAKSRFLATMTHELRTPLNAIIGFSDALARDANDHLMHDSEVPAIPPIDRDRLREFSGAIQEAGQHLLNLINTILDVTRIESGQFDLAADVIEIEQLAQGGLRGVRTLAETGEVSVAIELPPGLPRLRGDERRLRQVVAKLLDNAVKFTRSGGRVVVNAELEPAGDLLLHVTDTGIGIADQYIERVFEPFSQLDTSLARKAPGAGLGLYFCRALVEGHGGTLSLRSSPGFGTTVTIRLPRRRLVESPSPLELMQEVP